MERPDFDAERFRSAQPPHPDAPHPSGNDRYAIYATAERLRAKHRIAETSRDGIGTCLATLRDEGQITDDTRVGILDRETRIWLVNPWARGDV